VGRGQGDQLPFGSNVSVGSVTCQIPPETVARGISCINTSTGHGFEASRVASRQKVF
jgi:hypothetical protein